MLLQKTSRPNGTKRLYLIGLIWLVGLVFVLTGCPIPPQPVPVEMVRQAHHPERSRGIAKVESTEPNAVEIPQGEPADSEIIEIHKAGLAEPNFAEIPKTVLAEPNALQAIYKLIYQGKFDAADELIKYRQLQLYRLGEIVREYRCINQRREQAREAAYKKQLAKLEKFQDFGELSRTVAADTNDVNDVNDISKILSAIVRVREFADQKQNQELLSDSFVKQTFQKAIDKAAEFEAKGKWLDAYLTCYSWLQVIEPDNEGYSDHAEQLLGKANIIASFQDSACETSNERFQGVKKKMFIRAIDALNFNYVGIIDYRQMATKAVRRCKLLAEVMGKIADSNSVERIGGEKLNAICYTLNAEELAAWSAALTAILDEVNQSPTGMSKDKFIDVFEKVLALNSSLGARRTSSAPSVATQEARSVLFPRPMLIAQFAEAALSVLDPYTIIIWPRQVPDFEKTMTDEFVGIGIEISKRKGLLTVVSLLPDTPAYNSGLDAGDVIEAVDGIQTKDMTLICAVKRITGISGTKVTLTVRSPGEEMARDITITRAKITVRTIRGWQRTERGRWLYMIDEINRIGYVRLTNFSERTAADLEKVLGQLEAEGLRGLILDLRFNSGGLLSSAIEVTDKFIKEGLIVSTRPRFGVWAYAPAHKRGTHPNYPLVILINSSSASASEIVAGALADEQHNRAILVGSRTHGKGSVQGITHYPGGGARLKYTMAYYHLPSGQRVESQYAMKKLGRGDWGIAPNIEVKLRKSDLWISDELKKMLDVQRDNDVLARVGYNKGGAALKRHTVEETLESDPQLAVAELVVRAKLIEMQSAKKQNDKKEILHSDM